jgi:RimJ/RimL family protein N-acetyltransferase
VFGWADPRLSRTMCIIDPGNAPSRRLAERLGFVAFAEGLYRDKPTLILERTMESLRH